MKKVFLGGTCPGWLWRDELQPLLKCGYYNPIVEDWTPADLEREIRERQTSDFVLYGITNDMEGVYSIAEVVDDSNKRPEKTIYLNLYREDRPGYSARMAKSLAAVEKLVKANGAQCFHTIREAAEYINSHL